MMYFVENRGEKLYVVKLKKILTSFPFEVKIISEIGKGGMSYGK